ncbi:PAS domain-containing protein, partial [bacterium]|nr:PAS domain-containing protein [candidate division CSSED10-310 bacterium]
GLCKYNLYRKQFDHFQAIPGDKNTLSGNVISSIHSARPGELWVGNDLDGGINRFIFHDEKSYDVLHYKYNPQSNNSIGGNSILSLVQRKNGEVWAGSAGGSVSKIIPEEYGSNQAPVIKRYNLDRWTFSILEDRQGTLWGGTWDAGLWRYNETEDVFAFFRNDPDNPLSLCDNIVWSITEDHAGNIWVGGHGEGLSILPVKEKYKSHPRFINYKHEDRNPKSISNNTIHVMYQDHSGTMWIGTNGGLNKVIRKNNNFRHLDTDQDLEFFSYHINDGLPSEGIIGIVEDNEGSLWLSTGHGLSNFNTVQDSFINYDATDGLQSNEFWHNAYFRDQNGRIYFGGNHGFNAFYPDSIKSNPFPPKVIFTDFKLFYKSVQIGEQINNDIILTKSINETSEIFLSHNNNILSIEFAALHYAQPDENRYAYKLEGFNKDWVETSADFRSASYTSLPPGEYTFKVKASNSDGIWNEEGVSMTLIIHPSFWQTIWFKLILLMLFAGILFRVYKRLEQNRKRAEEKRIEKVVARERFLLRLVIDSVPDRIYVKDTEGRFVITNAAVCRKLSLNQPEDAVGKTDFDFYTKELAKQYSTDDIAVLESGQAIIDKEEFAVDSAGNPQWTLTTKIPLRDDKGKIIGLVGVGHHITARKQMEEALRNKQEALVQQSKELKTINTELEVQKRRLEENAIALKRSNEELEQFAYVASHDLQEPLRMITSYLNLIVQRYRDKLDEDALEFVDFVVDGAECMRRLINDLLSYSRVTTKGEEFQDIDCEEMLQQVRLNLKVTIEEKQATITHSPLPAIHGDKSQIERLFQNLIGNAIKYCEQKPVIHIQAKQLKESREFSIQDNGIGIDPKYQDKIFGIFQRLHGRDEYSGTGIGLAVCKKIVERHGGTIRVESEGKGKGSTFYFTI